MRPVVLVLAFFAPARWGFEVRRAPVLFFMKRRLARGLSATTTKQRVVFLGSPGVAAQTLKGLVEASTAEASCFEVVGAVSQPPAPKGRKRQVQKSEVQDMAEVLGLETLTPDKARDPAFLERVAAWRPDLCVTAAYGQFLPRAFLEIPRMGTLNIHPSLLPRWRGAAPLQRSLEAGDSTVGVSVLQTVVKMDAGPILAQATRAVSDDDDDGEALLAELFATGTDLLVGALPAYFDGSLPLFDQDEALVTEAPKLDTAEARLDLLSPTGDGRTIAEKARDKIRAFHPWPVPYVALQLGDGEEEVVVKVTEARVIINPPPRLHDDDDSSPGGQADPAFYYKKNKLLGLACADGSLLGLKRLTPLGKKPQDAGSFWNGLPKETRATLRPAPYQPGEASETPRSSR